jgi:hypothetical protein
VFKKPLDVYIHKYSQQLLFAFSELILIFVLMSAAIVSAANRLRTTYIFDIYGLSYTYFSFTRISDLKIPRFTRIPELKSTDVDEFLRCESGALCAQKSSTTPAR